MNNKILLVGDNPFHGISHLSQERAINRGNNLTNPNFAADLVQIALDNGADGFMFSVSDTTLSVLRQTCIRRRHNSVQIYALAPYIFEFVRIAVAQGGMPGLAQKMGREIVMSRNIGALIEGAKGVINTNPSNLLKAYSYM